MCRRWILVLAVVVVAACGPDTNSTSTASTQPTTPVSTPATTSITPLATSTAAPTSTARSPASEALPVYFRFDQSGLYLVDETGERQLHTEAVVTASPDAMGGAVFTVVGDAWRPGLQWWKAGTAAAETLPYDGGWVATLGDGPMLVTADGPCPERDDGTLFRLVDLRTGDERNYGCFGGDDGGWSLVTGGGELLVAVRWLAVGSLGTDRSLLFFDTTGVEIDHPHNPVAESCEPCGLDAHLSPDGSLLAYRMRPDAKWSTDPEEQRRLDELTGEEWWETSRHIDGAVSVIDLATGDTLFTTTVPAGERLTDFDGRYLALETCEAHQVDEHEPAVSCASRLVDSIGDVPEVSVAGSVRLATEILGAPPTADAFPPFLRVTWPYDGATVNERRIRFEGIAEPDAQLVAAGRYPVEIEPHGAWSILLALNPGGNVATFTATDAAGNETVRRIAVTYEVGGLLQPGGIATVDFGTPAAEALERLADILGPPSRTEDGERYGCYAYVDQQHSVTWDDLGFRAVFTDWDDSLHLASWQLFGAGIATDSGIGWGSSVADLRAAYPDVVFGINEWAPEFSIDTGMIRGGFDWPDFVADLQAALNEHRYALDVTGEWDGPTTGAVLDFIEAQGLHGPHQVLSALGIPSPDVRVSWINAGQEWSCA